MFATKISYGIRLLLLLATLCVMVGEGTELYVRELDAASGDSGVASALDEMLDDYFLILVGLYAGAVALTGRISVINLARFSAWLE